MLCPLKFTNAHQFFQGFLMSPLLAIQINFILNQPRIFNFIQNSRRIISRIFFSEEIFQFISIGIQSCISLLFLFLSHSFQLFISWLNFKYFIHITQCQSRVKALFFNATLIYNHFEIGLA